MPVNGPDDASKASRADVELRLPADGAYVSVLRTATAGLAARLDFTIDDIEDLRIAVGEASAMVLPEAAEGSDLVCKFHLIPGELTLSLSVPVESEREPDYDSFAWQVLSTLASNAEVDQADGRFAVRLSMRSSALGAGL
jgi:serine/threonine-protein kinase RsbW